MREDALKGFRFTPGTVRSEIFREGARHYNPSYGGQVDNLKKEVKEERRVYEVEEGHDNSPVSVPESDLYSSNSSSMKGEPSTPTNEPVPQVAEDEKVRGSKRAREPTPSTSS